MTVSSETDSVSYVLPSIVTPLPVTFRFLEDGDLRVVHAPVSGATPTALTLNSDYTVTGARTQGGGTVTLLISTSAGDTVSIDRGNMARTQLVDYRANDPFPEEDAEDIADRLTMLLQQAGIDGGRRSLTLFPTDPTTGGRYNANGNRIVSLADGLDPTDAATLQQVISAGSGNFIQSGTGAVIRTVQDKLRAVQLSVEDFGAVGDGVTNDYAAIMRAVTAASTIGDSVEIVFERATYAVASPIVLDGKAVRFRGRGSRFPAYNGAPATTGTTIKYTGSAGATVFRFQHMSGNHGLKGIGIDCNGLAAIGLDMADVYLGEYEDLSIIGQTGTAMRTGAYSGSPGGGTSWCDFKQIYLEAYGAGRNGYHATGVDVNNTCHNHFHQLIINHSDGGVGLRLGYSDNNKFDLTFINRVGGATGEGVLVVPAEEPLYPLFPESNYFYHLQAGAGGWVQPSNARTNYIFGYDQSNGQPFPVLNGSDLFYTYFGGLRLGAQEFVKDINAWTAYTPTVTANAGTITTLGARNGIYLVRGKTVFFHVNVTITTNGTGSSFISIGLPPSITPGGTAGFNYMASGRQFGGSNAALMASVTQGGTTMAVLTATGTYPGADGVQLCVSGQYAIN